MSIEIRPVGYSDNKIDYEGILAVDSSRQGRRPGILVAHTIRGRSPFEESKAEQLAKLGYAAFAIDIYGKAELRTPDDNTRRHMEALRADRAALQRRLLLALRTLQAQPEVDPERIAVIGFCFGGLCALDMARGGAPVAGAVSFHGLLDAPTGLRTKPIEAKILVLHGWDDPLATPDAVVELGTELTAAGADWQLHAYGNTMHAFTNPAANDKARGTVYDASAERRSWAAMTRFLDEIFSG